MAFEGIVRARWIELGVVLVCAAAGCGGSAGDEIACGQGTRLDGDSCVADTEIECGEGTRVTDGVCLPTVSTACGDGTILDGDECIPDGSGSTLTCGEGTALEGSQCVARSSVTCGEGTTLVNRECLPLDDAITCGVGTTLSGGECVPEDGLTCGPGTIRSGDECVPTTVTCGPGTRLQGNQCVVVSGSSTPTSSTFAFTIAERGATSIVYFLDTSTPAVHRYDLASDQFLTPYALTEPATTMTVTQAGDVVYLGSPGGRINSIDTATGNPNFLVAAPETVLWMAAVDAFLYTIDGSGSWETHTTYRRSNGERTFSADWRNASNGVAYAPASHRIFTFRDGTSPNDIYYEILDPISGALSQDVESPYHGDYNLGHPIRVSPDETRVYVSSGVIFSAADVTYVGSIGISYVDLAFHGDRLYLLRASASDSQLVVMDATYAIVTRVTIIGTPLRLFVHGGELTVFTRGMDSAIATWAQEL
jgi:hypothetical protein